MEEIASPADQDLLEKYADLWTVDMREITVLAGGSSAILLVSPGRMGIRIPVHSCASPLIREGFRETPPIRPMLPDLFRSVADELEVTVPVVLLDVDAAGQPTAKLVLSGLDFNAEIPAPLGDAMTVAQRMDSIILATPQFFDPEQSVSRAKKALISLPRFSIPAVSFKPLQRAYEVIDMNVLEVINSRSGALIVLLVDSGHNSVLSMGVGVCEGLAIFDNLHGAQLRPAATHLMLAGLLSASGATMTEANIVDWRDQILIGEIELSYHGELISIDSRPSDAIALALLTDANIGVVRGLLEAFGQRAEFYRRFF